MNRAKYILLVIVMLPVGAVGFAASLIGAERLNDWCVKLWQEAFGK